MHRIVITLNHIWDFVQHDDYIIDNEKIEKQEACKTIRGRLGERVLIGDRDKKKEVVGLKDSACDRDGDVLRDQVKRREASLMAMCSCVHVFVCSCIHVIADIVFPYLSVCSLLLGAPLSFVIAYAMYLE